jgi:hypothetical protein
VVKHGYETQPDDDKKDFKDIIVPVQTLEKVFHDYQVEHIDFMKIDVEGYEYEVLESNDWDKYRPEVLCIEANHIVHDWRPLLEAARYELVFNDNLNDFYVDCTTNRKSKFNFVKDVINDRGGGIRAEYFEQLSDLYSYAIDKTNHVKELQSSVRDLKQEVRQLQFELKQYESIRVATKQLKTLVKRRVGKTMKRG